MRITQITAAKDEIRFALDAPVRDHKIRVSLYPAALGEEAELCSVSMTVNGASFALPRKLSGRDGLTLCYVTADAAGEVEGKKYVENAAELAARTFPFPVRDSKKGLQVSMTDDALALGIRHAALNVSLGDLLMDVPEGGDTLFFRFEGRDFYIRKSAAERLDARVKALSDAGVTVYLILLNSRRWETAVSGRFWEKIRHPAYDEAGNISMFDVVREEGCRYYRAFVAFLAGRYTREDEKYGRAPGFIIGNEVDSQWIWANAGEMELAQFAEQYTTALRVAYQCAAAVYANVRIFISLDHFWSGRMDEDQPRRFYPSRELLSGVAAIAAREGDFPWHVAFHPYPQNLFRPDFWNDDTAPHDAGAYRVTFNNPEVLRDFLARPEMRYRGEVRRIIFSEQGFHSDFTPEGEALQAEAFRRAWEKVMEIPEIDCFIYHAHVDHIEEGGLNLGLWRRKKDSGALDAPKPIWEVFRTIDR